MHYGAYYGAHYGANCGMHCGYTQRWAHMRCGTWVQNTVWDASRMFDWFIAERSSVIGESACWAIVPYSQSDGLYVVAIGIAIPIPGAAVARVCCLLLQSWA